MSAAHIFADGPGRPRNVDLPRAERAVAELIEALGYDVQTPAFVETPTRVAQAFADLTSGVRAPMSVFPNDNPMTGPIMVRDIAFVSLCEHHLLPFQGRVHVVYTPGELIGGFSAFAHAVEMFAHTLGLQETLTVQLANYLMEHMRPHALAVTVEAQHMCMTARGAKARETSIVTREVLGERTADPSFQAALAFGVSPD